MCGRKTFNRLNGRRVRVKRLLFIRSSSLSLPGVGANAPERSRTAFLTHFTRGVHVHDRRPRGGRTTALIRPKSIPDRSFVKYAGKNYRFRTIFGRRIAERKCHGRWTAKTTKRIWGTWHDNNTNKKRHCSPADKWPAGHAPSLG